MSRDELRTKLLASKKTPVIEIDYQGTKIGIKTPTVKQREDLVSDIKGNAELVADALINFVVDLETGAPIFEDTDKDTLINQEVGGIIDTLGPEIIKAISGNQDVKKPI